MFFQRLLRRRAPCKKLGRQARPRLEVLEDRCLLANFTWNGPAEGLMSQAANWIPNNTGVPGPGDTAIFNNTNNNNAVFDLQNHRVGVLRIEGYTGTIKLQRILIVDVLTMSSGTIAEHPQWLDQGAQLRMGVNQNGATVFGASSWTGGNIGGGGANFVFRLSGSAQHPLTFNVGSATSTPTFAGIQWFIGSPLNRTEVTVNWDQGNITMGPVGTTAGEILNLGTFMARSSGQISGPEGRKWDFTNDGDLVVQDADKQFIRCKPRNRKGGNTYKLQVGLGTFTIAGDLVQEGNLQIEGGAVHVTGTFTQQREFPTDPDPITTVYSQTSLVTGPITMTDGTVTDEGTIEVAGTLQQNGGTISLIGGTLSATAGYNLDATALLEGSGGITADILSSGTIDVGGTGAAGTLGIAGNYTQSASGLLNLEFGAAGDTDLLSVSGSVALDGTLLMSTLAGFAGEQVTVIDNTGSSPISGTFAGLPEGSVFSLDGYLYQLTYQGGDGYDVVLNPYSPSAGQWASYVIDFSSEYTPSPGDWSAAQALGAPDTLDYGDIPTSWSAATPDNGIEFLTVGFDTPVYAAGVTVRETYGNGFVTQIDLVDEFDQLHTIWTGTDPSQPGTPVEFTVSFAATDFLVKGVRVYVNTDHNPGDWEDIDAVMLHGDAGGGGGFAALSAPSSTAAPRPTRVASVKKPNRGPSATLRAGGPVALGRAVDFVFSNPRDGFRSVPASSFRYSFDFNNDGDFTDSGEVLNGTSTSARHTFTRRGWHVIHGRVLGPNGRYTDFWLRVFVS